MAQSGTEENAFAQAGNTKKRLRSRGWFLTINNFTPDDETNIRNIGADRWVYQEEIGDSGTPHLQVFLYFKNPIEVTTIHRWFPKAHHAYAKSYKESINYCSKSQTRVRGPFTHNIELPKITLREKLLNRYNSVVWKDWQQKILDILETEPDARTIHCVVDIKGNSGKSFLCKYIDLKYDVIIASGKKEDIFNQVKLYMEENKEPRIVLLDIPRSQDRISWGAIEALKNGHIYSGKYEGRKLIFDYVHVIIFTNHEPPRYEMSADRWNIIYI